MICPYCNIAFSVYEDSFYEDIYPIPCDDDENNAGGYKIKSMFCPECNQYIILLQYGKKMIYTVNFMKLESIDEEILLYPKFPINKSISSHVPKKYSDIYLEASQVNYISPRASATLSRYLLQMILHEELKIKKKTLAEEISEFEKLSNVPSNLSAMLQILRRVANFGAHPKKSTNSNEILEIEQGEADIMLELIEQLFDFQFIKPAQQAEFLKDIQTKYGIKP